MSEHESKKRLTITDIENKVFRCVAYGYDQHDVDEFLDSICDEMEQMVREVANLRSELDLANAQARKAEAAGGFVPAAVTKPEDSFREILEMAQRVKDQTIADAQKRAEDIVAQAQAEADAQLGGLEAEHARLEGLVVGLREKVRGYRDAVSSLIREQQEALDAIDLGGEEE